MSEDRELRDQLGFRPTPVWVAIGGKDITIEVNGVGEFVLPMGARLTFLTPEGKVYGAGKVDYAGLMKFVPVYAEFASEPYDYFDPGFKIGEDINIRINGFECEYEAETWLHEPVDGKIVHPGAFTIFYLKKVKLS